MYIYIYIYIYTGALFFDNMHGHDEGSLYLLVIK